jgi:glycosyltransferase involved in cell wall biosynthesis
MWIHNPDHTIQQNMRNALRKTMNNSCATLISCPRIEGYLHEACLQVNKIIHFPFIPDNFVVASYDEAIYTKKKLVIGWIGNASPHCHEWLKRLETIKSVCHENPEKFVLRYHNKWEKNDIPYSKVHDFYHEIDIYVCFSLYEGSPNTIMEASACGRAWISTDVGEVSELIRYDPECGIVIERGAVQLLEKMLYLYENRGKIADMGNRGRKVIEKYYSLDVLCKNVSLIQ